jgi:hypothetical protein
MRPRVFRTQQARLVSERRHSVSRGRLSVVERAPQVIASAANDVWTIDFKGWWRATDRTRCDPLTVRDACSRFSPRRRRQGQLALPARRAVLSGRMRSALVLLVLLGPALALGATSSRSVPSTFTGNGHNISFDGRLLITRDSVGWEAYLFRPEAVTYGGDGLPDAMGPMWSPKTTLLTGPDPTKIGENALAICAPDAARAPYACDEDGNAAAGPYDCYDVWIFDSDALLPVEQGGTTFRRRRLQLWVESPRSAAAKVHKFQWTGAIEILTTTTGGNLNGIEATFTADGKLLAWNGTTTAARQNESLSYSTNPTPCAGTGWAPAHPISHMTADPATRGVYRLAERTLRAADGTPFADGDPIPGAYPWLLPNGDAILFQASNMRCRGTDDPHGCGPRRNQTSVLGYPTNWGVAVIDGGINPDTDETVRLFFSSPGPKTFPELPVTKGSDVWPFFGSNTSNYVEISFDDGLDGDYAGLWHMNESVTPDGFLDPTRSPDVSGYFNTAVVPLPLPPRNLLGKPVAFNGTSGAVTVPNDATLDPTQKTTIDLAVTPAAAPDCDANNNWRVLLHKGDLGTGEYLVTYNDDGTVGVRFNPVGTHDYWVGTSAKLKIGVTTRLTATYDAATGTATMWVNGVLDQRNTYPPAPLPGATDPVVIGGPGTTQPACPNGAGVFDGTLDQVDISTRDVTLGAQFPAKNNGLLGKAVVLDGMSGHLEVAHSTSLSPVNAITMEIAVNPAADPDCDGQNNFRVLLQKGTAYSLIFEDTRGVRARVQVAGGAIYDVYSVTQLAVGQWSRVAAVYDGATGDLAFFVDGKETNRSHNPPAQLMASTDVLTIGGPVGARPACPDGNGAFAGAIDEVAISRVARSFGAAPVPDAGTVAPPAPDAPAAAPPPMAAGGGGGGCAVGGPMRGAALVLLVIAAVQTAAWARRRRRSSRRGEPRAP